METARAPQRLSTKIGAYFFGALTACAWLIQLVPALLGHRMDQHASIGIAILSAVFGYCLWTYRGRKGWEGALAALGAFLVIWIAANYLSGINPAP